MRLFVAVELEPQLAGNVAGCVEELRRRAEGLAPRARIGWVPSERLHVTVRFLGEVADEARAVIAAALQADVPVSPFEIVVEGVGSFPDRGAPRVLWAGIGAGAERLVSVEGEVGRRLAGCGIPRDRRPYRPHITIARVRDPATLRAGPLLETCGARRFGASRVGAITLFQSRPSLRGPEYVVLQRTPLRRPAGDDVAVAGGAGV